MVYAKLSGTTWLTIGIHTRAHCGGGRERVCVGQGRADGTSGLACCSPELLRESFFLLAVRSLAGALSQTMCCLIR